MKKTTWCAAALGGLGGIAWMALRRRSWMELANKVVVITGGSRGLGLQLAREFGAHGAIVVVASRDEAELDRASDDLRQRGITVHSIVCDVSDQAQSEHLIREAVRKAGKIDVLVNNAGVIQVGPLSEMTVADFENAMGVMFWGTLYPTLAVIPAMRERQQGRIVNITSIGGKMSVPHLLPYCCAKFAAVALSEGLRTELNQYGIKVTTVVPGLMRTGSHVNAMFKGEQGKEYAWFSLAAATPLISIGGERAARAIVRATVRGDAERILSIPAQLAARVHGLAPDLTSVLSTLINRLLPKADGKNSGALTSTAVRGAEARSELNSRVLNAATVTGRHAAEALNQLS